MLGRWEGCLAVSLLVVRLRVFLAVSSFRCSQRCQQVEAVAVLVQQTHEGTAAVYQP